MWRPPKLLFSLLCVTKCKANSHASTVQRPHAEFRAMSGYIVFGSYMLSRRKCKNPYTRQPYTPKHATFIHTHTRTRILIYWTHTKWIPNPDRKRSKTQNHIEMEMKKQNTTKKHKKCNANEHDGTTERGKARKKIHTRRFKGGGKGTHNQRWGDEQRTLPQRT